MSIVVQKTLVSLLVVSVGVAGFWYFFSTQEGGVVLYSSSLDKGVLATNSQAVKQQTPTRDEQEAEIAASFDEYGFPKTWDLTQVGYAPDLITVLYKEGNYTYSIYSRETGVSMPIVKESSTTKEYVGLTLRPVDILSPDKRRFAYIRNDVTTAVTEEMRGQLCIAQIDPKLIKCTHPQNGETFTVFVGEYDQMSPRGEWIDDVTFRYAVFTYNEQSTVNTTNETKPLRFETISF